MTAEQEFLFQQFVQNNELAQMLHRHDSLSDKLLHHAQEVYMLFDYVHTSLLVVQLMFLLNIAIISILPILQMEQPHTHTIYMRHYSVEKAMAILIDRTFTTI